MKKALISFAAFAAIVCVGYADTEWFNGGIGSSTRSGGNWTDPLPTGVTSNETNFALEDVELFRFSATDSKSTSASQNLDITSKIKFTYAYDEFPDVAANDKAGIIVYANGSATNYWVLATNTANSASSLNVWVDTGIAAPDDLSDEVSVNIVLSNGVNSTWAIYNIDDDSFTTNITTSSSSFQYADYSGSGYIDSLVAYLVSLGIPVPGRDPIPQEAADAWAAKYNIPNDKLASLMQDTTTKFNGRTFADSCILGVGTNEVINSAIVDAADQEGLKFVVSCTNVGNRAMFTLKRGSETVGSAQSSMTFTSDLVVGVYTIVAQVDGGEEFSVSDKSIGVKTGSTTSGFFAVPYTALDGDIAISNIFKKSQLADKDQIDIFDSASSEWKSFRFDGTDKEWKGVPKSGEDTPDPRTTTLKRGQAFKFTLAGSNTPYYLGYVSTATATISMPSKKYELVGMSDGTAYALSNAGSNDWAMKVDGDAVLPNEKYEKKGDGWKKIIYTDGVPSYESAETIDGGFFLMNRGNTAKDMSF